MKRVVVTGMGLVTPIGNSIEEYWKNIHAGKVGIGPIRNFDTTDYKAKLSAEVTDFEPKDYMSAKDAKRMDRFSQFAVAAATQAVNNSGIDMKTHTGQGCLLAQVQEALWELKGNMTSFLQKDQHVYIRFLHLWY